MGTDWARLFDKRQCDEILALKPSEVPRFAQDRLHLFAEFNEWRDRFGEEESASERLKYKLVDSLCVTGDWLYLDYWACYAEVFVTDPPGSIPDYELFPHLEEQGFLLLLPTHVDRMLASLAAHHSELRVMSPEHVAQLRQWRDECARDSEKMVAYFLDY
jgi:hypothetical protein